MSVRIYYYICGCYAKIAFSQNSLCKGEVAIIIDPDNLSKTLLLPSELPFCSSTLPKQMAMSINSDECGEIKSAFLLEVNQDISQMPTLSPLDPSQTLQDFNEAQLRPYSRSIAAAKANTPSNVVKEEKVKAEPDDDSGSGISGETVTADAPTSLPPIDWIKAYETFLSIVTGTTQRRRFDKDASLALPQIAGVVSIANRYNAVSALENTFNGLLLQYINNKSLFPSIATHADSWLVIGLIMKNSNVFEEAFPHLAGCFPEFWPFAKLKERIPGEVFAAIEAKARTLRYSRYEVDHELLTLGLATMVGDQDAFVGQNAAPVAYDTLNVWRDYICEHLGYVKTSTGGDKLNLESKKSPTCNHKDVCLTVAGFYRLLGKGGDAYLPTDEVLKKEWWNKERYKCDNIGIRQNLAILKTQAAEIVKSLTESTLQYEQKDQLRYLTCISMRDVPQPWEKEDEDDDQMMER